MNKAVKINEIIDAFDARPLESQTNMDKFYVSTSEARGEDAAAKLMLVLNNGTRPNKKILFIGHHGCGKSTELCRAAEELKDKYLVIRYSIGEYLDFLSTSYIDVIFSTLRSIMLSAAENKIAIDSKIVDDIFEYWNQEKILTISEEEKKSAETGIESTLSIPLLKLLALKIKFFLQANINVKQDTVRKISPTIPQLIEKINSFLNDFKNRLNGKQLLLIIDDLDKLPLENARSIFIENSKPITSLNLNIVYTFPIYLYYSPEFRCIQTDFYETILLSMIKVKYRSGGEFNEGIKTLENIIRKRADLSLFENGVIDFTIKKSGGCIRTAFRLLRDASLKAELYYLKFPSIAEDKRIISMDNIIAAYNAYKSEIQRVIRKDEIELLKEIHQNKNPIIDEDNILVMKLLMSLAVIEYNGERWCDLNPAIEDYLIENHLLT